MESQQEKKLRGGYYTPNVIADFITKWAIRSKNDSVLEPSCGDGVFINSAVSRFRSLQAGVVDISKNIYAVELNIEEAMKVKNLMSKFTTSLYNEQIYIGDFFFYCDLFMQNNRTFDCIIGNPPFIRYQDFPEEQKKLAISLMIRAGINPNRLTNTWMAFLVASTLLLNETGRIGMVIPAELFQVNYAAETRQFLSNAFTKIHIVTFKQLVFDNIQQEVILFLGEKSNIDTHSINVIEVNNTDDLHCLDLDTVNNSKFINHSTDKWTQYFLDQKEINLLRKIRTEYTIPIISDYMSVDVGVVTGQNQYFVLSHNEINQKKLSRFSKRIVSKSNQLQGIVLSENDWNEISKMQQPNYLLDLPNVDYPELPKEVQEYVDYGERIGINSGYKCRIRKRWWSVPSIWSPDAFVLRQVHSYPKIVVNECNATSTDTVHRVKFINGERGLHVAAAFLNSLTFAFAEITGRSYGGGVLTFEPSEIEKLPIPLINAEKIKIDMIDTLLRMKNIESVLDITDKVLLYDGLGLSYNDINILRGIWRKLRDRRNNRKNRYKVS